MTGVTSFPSVASKLSVMEINRDLWYINRVLEGDANAFAPLVDKYQNMVFTIALRIVIKREDAEEVAQDTFLKVYRSLNTFRLEATFSTWLYRIAYNTAISHARKKQLPITPIDGEEGHENIPDTVIPSAWDVLKQAQQKDFLDRALQELPETDRITSPATAYIRLLY